MNHKKLQGPCPLFCETCFRDAIAGYLFAIAPDSRLGDREYGLPVLNARPGYCVWLSNKSRQVLKQFANE
jgi:hypothetical protein